MRKIIHEIRNQPAHVRELATMLCTVVVVAIVGLLWFRSFQHDIYTMLNPKQSEGQAQDQLFAQQSKSLFGSISQVLKDGKAQIFNLFTGSSQTDITNSPASSNSSSNNQAHPLPVSGSK